MRSEELEEKVAMLTQQTAALIDVLALMCTEISERDLSTTLKIASSLEAMADNPNIETTAAFAELAPWFAGHLRRNMC